MDPDDQTFGGFEDTSEQAGEVETPVETDNSQDSPTDGINPAWNPVLENIPPEFHNHLIPHFQQWDSNYQKSIDKARSEVQSQYEPFKDMDPGQVTEAMQLRAVLENNPQQVYELLQQEFGQQVQNDDQGSDYDEDSFNPQSIENDPKFQELQNNFNSLTEAMQNESQQREEQELYNQELQNIETTLGDLGPKFKEKFGFDMDGEEVMRIALQELEMNDADALDIPAAAERFGSLVSRYRTPEPGPGQQTPNFLPTSGGIPQQNVNLAELSEDQRENMVAQMLANANKQ